MSKKDTTEKPRVSDEQVEQELKEPTQIQPANFTLAGIQDEIRVPVHTDCLIHNGTTRRIKWAVTVKRCTVEQHDEYMKNVTDGAMTDFEVAKAVIVDWHLLKTTEGQKIPFNEPNLMAVFNIPEYKKSLTSAIYDVMSGGARKKMFKP